MRKSLLMKALSTVMFFGLTFVGGAAGADGTAVELMQKSDCLVCHKTDQKLVGPSFQDIANRYKDDPSTRKMLIQKVIGGGGGVWGDIPMVPHADISIKDAEEIVQWILSQNS